MSEIIAYSDLRQTKMYDKPLLYNLDAINQSIMNILVTNPGERLFLPEFGAGLKRYLFELPGTNTEFDILNNIINAISRWETRVQIVEGSSSVTYDSSTFSYNIAITYNVPSIDVNSYRLNIIAPLEIA